MMLLGKVVLGLLGLGAVGGIIVATTHDAKASPKESDVLPADLRAKEQSALQQADPLNMREVADEIEAAGFPKQAETLRAAAKAIEDAIKDVTPDPIPPGPGPAPGPGPSPVVPPFVPPGPGPAPGPAPRPPAPEVKSGRVIHVLKGEGPFQVQARVFGNRSSMEHLHELQAANVPFDADGVARVIDHHTGQIIEARGGHGLDAGDRLNVPASWPSSPHITTEQIGLPLAAIRGDAADVQDADLRKLAGRVALEVASHDKGSENRDLVATFQNAERSRGRRQGPSTGLYDAETALCLALVHGIAPPTIFGDGKELYYATNPAPEKAALRDCLQRLAMFDPRRADEYMQCAAGVQ